MELVWFFVHSNFILKNICTMKVVRLIDMCIVILPLYIKGKRDGRDELIRQG